MAVSALNVTPSSPTANAYVTLAVANQYHEDRPAVGTTWSAATDDQKNAAILWATQLLDRLWCWAGQTTTAEQALQWPRSGVITANGWNSVNEFTIPTEIQKATAEYARQLLVGDIAGNSEVETQGLKSLTAGPVSLVFKDNVTAKPVPDTVVYLIPHGWGYLIGRSTGFRPLMRA